MLKQTRLSAINAICNTISQTDINKTIANTPAILFDYPHFTKTWG